MSQQVGPHTLIYVHAPHLLTVQIWQRHSFFKFPPKSKRKQFSPHLKPMDLLVIFSTHWVNIWSFLNVREKRLITFSHAGLNMLLSFLLFCWKQQVKTENDLVCIMMWNRTASLESRINFLWFYWLINWLSFGPAVIVLSRHLAVVVSGSTLMSPVLNLWGPHRSDCPWVNQELFHTCRAEQITTWCNQRAVIQYAPHDCDAALELFQFGDEKRKIKAQSVLTRRSNLQDRFKHCCLLPRWFSDTIGHLTCFPNLWKWTNICWLWT